ncbi:MAG: DUF4326 domain-containing protein [Thioploca sp.]|nr:DUF4326 domain-containing protein [Thioploca sp.]
MNLLELSKYVVHKNKKPYDVYIGRPSKWGNPFSHKDGTLAKFKTSSLEESIKKYEEWVLSQPDFIFSIKKELKGKVLGCWCAPKMCHGYILARIANEI